MRLATRKDVLSIERCKFFVRIYLVSVTKEKRQSWRPIWCLLLEMRTSPKDEHTTSCLGYLLYFFLQLKRFSTFIWDAKHSKHYCVVFDFRTYSSKGTTYFYLGIFIPLLIKYTKRSLSNMINLFSVMEIFFYPLRIGISRILYTSNIFFAIINLYLLREIRSVRSKCPLRKTITVTDHKLLFFLTK